MYFHTQTLKEILHTISQMHDILHKFKEYVKDDFRSIHKSFMGVKEKCTLMKIMNEYHQ
jgi:hypothetical protein